MLQVCTGQIVTASQFTGCILHRNAEFTRQRSGRRGTTCYLTLSFTVNIGIEIDICHRIVFHLEVATAAVKDKNKCIAQVVYIGITKCINVNESTAVLFLPLVLETVSIPFLE